MGRDSDTAISEWKRRVLQRLRQKAHLSALATGLFSGSITRQIIER